MPLRSPIAIQLDAIARRAKGIGPISTENKWNGLRSVGELGSIDPIAIEKASWDASDPAIKAAKPALEGWMQEAGEIGHCIVEQTTDYHNFSDAPYATYFIGKKPVFSEVLHEDASGDATMVPDRLLGRPALKVVVAADETDPAGIRAKWGRVEFGHYGENGFAGSISVPFLEKDLAASTPDTRGIEDWKHPDLMVGLLRECNEVLYNLGEVAVASGVSRQQAF